jgi:hypothetical protein
MPSKESSAKCTFFFARRRETLPQVRLRKRDEFPRRLFSLFELFPIFFANLFARAASTLYGGRIPRFGVIFFGIMTPLPRPIREGALSIRPIRTAREGPGHCGEEAIEEGSGFLFRREEIELVFRLAHSPDALESEDCRETVTFYRLYNRPACQKQAPSSIL